MIRNFCKKNENYIIAIIITILTFLVFWGQWMYSDVVTFAKSGDQHQLCFSSFNKLGDLLSRGILYGIDSGSSNGATDFFLRGQIPVRYLPIMLFALVGHFTNSRIIYLFFWGLHMFVAMIFALKLSREIFCLPKYISILFATSCTSLFCFEMWYSSHAIISFLVIPLMYFAIKSINSSKWIDSFWYSILYVLGFTAGYITLSVELVGIVICFALFYGKLYRTDLNIKDVIVRVLRPVFIAGIIVLLYYLGVLTYLKMIVRAGSYDLADALAMNLNVMNLLKVVFHSFNGIDATEQLPIITIGTLWTIVLFVFSFSKRVDNINGKNSIFIKYCIGINLILFIVSFGATTPLGAWFYSTLPILGQTHLTIRYMMVTIPMMYLAFCILLNDSSLGCIGENEKKIYKISSFVILVGSLILCFVFSNIVCDTFDVEKLILELIITGIVLYYVSKEGWTSKKVLLLWSTTMFLIAVDTFYNFENVTRYSGEVNSSSLVYDEANQEIFQSYLSSLDKKEIYRFAHLDSTREVTFYIPGNYEWFGLNNENLSNYIGMDVHTCLPEDYRASFGWFDRIDWAYLYNTRADFIVADEGAIDKNIEQMQVCVDWDQSNVILNNIYRICKLKKYIPSYYTGGEYYQEDVTDNVLDNGFFYCPYLTQENILEFDTDRSTYFTLKVNSGGKNDIAFLSYPNADFVYFVDGQKIEPIIYQMQSYIPIEAGVHEIKIEYKNVFDIWGNYVMLAYYIIYIFAVVAFLIMKKVGKEKNHE